MKKIIPIKDKILVCLDARKEESKKGIYIPEVAQEAEEWGRVISAGDGCKEVRGGIVFLFVRRKAPIISMMEWI